MKQIFLTIFFLLLFYTTISVAFARSGCCSHHGGVCGCGCCDGSSLSATCAPYYPSCSGGSASTYTYTTPICIKPSISSSQAHWDFSQTSDCDQNVTIDWDKGTLDDFYSIGISKTAGADPGPLSDTNDSIYTFKNVKPGKWYINIKPGRSCGWGQIIYWTVDVPFIKPTVKIWETILSNDERKLNYSIKCATTAQIIPDLGNVSLSSTSATIRPSETTFYKLTAKNSNGDEAVAQVKVIYPLLSPTPRGNSLSVDQQIKNNSQGENIEEDSQVGMRLMRRAFNFFNRLLNKE